MNTPAGTISAVQEYENKIKELETRIIKAEQAMAAVWAFPVSNPTTEYMSSCLNPYRKDYPEAYKIKG